MTRVATPAEWTARCRPFFTIFGPNERITSDSIATRLDAAQQAQCDVVMCFVEHEGYALWPSQFVERAPNALDVDAVGLLADQCRERGLRFVAEWMGAHCQSLHTRKHPSWMQRDALGNPAPTMCLNSPFGDLILAEVGEVVDRYALDGVYFDGLYARFGGCYCDYCQAQFRATYGHDIPKPPLSSEPVEVSRREHWLEFSIEPEQPLPELDAFRFATVANYCRRVRALLDRRRPGTQLILDTLGVSAAYYSMAHDLVRMSESVDVFLLESYWEGLREPVWHVGMECALVRAETGRPIWWPRWLARHPDGDQVGVPPATVQIWAGQALLHDASPAPVEQNLYAVDRSLQPVVDRALEAVKRGQQVLAGTRQLRYAVLVHSERTKRVYAPARHPRDYFDSFAGAYAALQEAHIPFEVIGDLELEQSGVPTDSRVVILPNAAVLSATAVDVLGEYVRQGGGLVASYRSGCDRADGLSDDSALADLLGFRSMGIGFRSGRVGPEEFGGREPVNYYRSLADHELTTDLDDRLFSFRGAYARVAATHASVCAELLDLDFLKMDGDRFFAWYPGAPSTPLLLTSTPGRGRGVYSAAPLDAVFFRQGWPEAADLLVRAVRWAAGEAPRVSIEAPPTVDARIRQDASGRLAVVLANRTTPDLYALGRPGTTHAGPGGATARAHFARAIVSVADVSIRLDWRSPAPPRVETLSGRTPDVQLEAGRLTVTLPRLDDFDVVQIGGG